VSRKPGELVRVRSDGAPVWAPSTVGVPDRVGSAEGGDVGLVICSELHFICVLWSARNWVAWIYEIAVVSA
jgi:hypothetical protein